MTDFPANDKPDTPILLRPIAPQDLLNLYKSCYADQPFQTVMAMLESSLAWQQKESRVHLLVGQGEMILGAGHVGRYGRKAEIADVIIAESFRRQGLGTWLVQSLIQIAQEKNWLPLEIGVYADNLPALFLYRRLGFLPKKTITLNRGGEAFILELPSGSRHF